MIKIKRYVKGLIGSGILPAFVKIVIQNTRSATTFEREDGIIAMKKFIQSLLKDFKNKDNQYHDRRDLSQTLLNAIKTLDDSLDRLYSTPCNCKECRREDSNDKR